MSEIYTANDLIRYIYQEITAEESLHIQHLIQHNLSAKEEYESLKDMIGLLDDVALDPSPTSIQIIMEHAHKHDAELI
jgi:hypothetical protein